MKHPFLYGNKSLYGILDSGLEALMAKAEELGATCGAGGIAIVFEDGKLYSTFEPIDGDWSKSYDMEKTWPGESEKGIDYLGYAMGKMAQSVRTGKPSIEDGTPDYGESASIGSACLVCKLQALPGNEETNFKLIAVYSGMTSEDDALASKSAVDAMSTAIKESFTEYVMTVSN